MIQFGSPELHDLDAAHQVRLLRDEKERDLHGLVERVKLLGIMKATRNENTNAEVRVYPFADRPPGPLIGCWPGDFDPVH
jgi:hypothetical protein